MIEYQNGNSNVLNDYSLFGEEKEVVPVLATEEGYVKTIKTTSIGTAAMVLGAGRATMNDVIDPTVGIKVYKKVGDKISKGEKIADVYTNGKNTETAINTILDSYVITKEQVEPRDIVLKVIGE